MTTERKRMPVPPAPATAPVHSTAVLGPLKVIITGEVGIPATSGYARRLNNLITDLRTSIEEQAPWLTKVTVDVERSKE